jgi:hypothetical protein
MSGISSFQFPDLPFLKFLLDNFNFSIFDISRAPLPYLLIRFSFVQKRAICPSERQGNMCLFFQALFEGQRSNLRIAKQDLLSQPIV